MDNLYWIGIRESEIKYTNFINQSITIFGKDNISMNQKIKKSIDHNNIKNFNIIDDFYNNEVKKIIKKNPCARFMYYSQIYSYESMKKMGYLDYVICLNKQELVEYLSNKFALKQYFKDFVPILDYQLLKGSHCTLENIKKEFMETEEEFVLQTTIGSGGSGTILMTKENEKSLDIAKEETYMVTKYCKNNIPINMHVLIAQDEIQLLPPSIQIIEICNNKLVYKGNDYIAYREKITNQLNKKFELYCEIIAKKIQKMGYRGICGIDCIVYNNEIYLMEINTRFQNSSTILNRALFENHLPSLQELHYNCFHHKTIKIKKIDVNYSCYIRESNQKNKNIGMQSIEELDQMDENIQKDPLCYLGVSVYNDAIYKKWI